MTELRKVKAKDIWMGKLTHGADLLEEITNACRQNSIVLGRLEGLGAVKKASLGYYNQEKRIYEFYNLEEPLEITNLTGNISVKDGLPMVHAHLTLSDRQGRAYGGHLAPGTIIFACELIIQTLEGPKFERDIDQVTGLPLWRAIERNIQP